MQDARGVSDFEALQAGLRSQPSRLIFYALTCYTSMAGTCSTGPWANADPSYKPWLAMIRADRSNSANSSLAMLPPSFEHVSLMS